MTKIKLTNGIIINATVAEIVNGVFRISTNELTVEELAETFSNKENTSLIVLMTEAGVESGYKTGFTSFAGINYALDGTKTIELIQPVDLTEARIAAAEGSANLAVSKAEAAKDNAEAAKNEAEAAKNEAEAAKDNAEAAKNEAEAAKNNAEAAKDNAEAAKNEAEAAKNNAEAAKDNAEAAKNEAEAAKNNAEAANNKANEVEASTTVIADTVDSLMSEVIPSLTIQEV